MECRAKKTHCWREVNLLVEEQPQFIRSCARGLHKVVLTTTLRSRDYRLYFTLEEENFTLEAQKGLETCPKSVN